MAGSAKPQSQDPEILIKQQGAKRRRPSNEINTNPTVVAAPNIELPAGYTAPEPKPSAADFGRTGDYKTPAGPGNIQGRLERRLSQMENIRTNPKYQRGRRIGYGAASAAVLANMLGIGRDDEEDRREQY
jgi:hypothetical protein